ncbi:MAG: hypothetical protein AABW67_04925 [Nanoarchaeota archaeon]
MGKREFDYYIFIDYSEDYLGYSIIEKDKIKEIIPKISKFAHYRELKYKSAYLRSIKNLIDRDNLRSFFCKLKIRKTSETPEIYSDILEFLKEHNNCLIFISVDNKQYLNFEKIVKIIDGENTLVVKESELKKNSCEYRISLVLDTMLNLVRLKNEKF